MAADSAIIRPRALEGMKVLDFSMGVAGPHAGALCALHGADVVKIESPGGDWSRVLGQCHGDFSAFSVAYNRGKRSLAIDLKSDAAQDAVRRMACEADVVIEAFRPGVMRKFQLDYDSLRRDNPGLVYLSVNGFGSSGPLRDAPATDAVVQAFTGFMHANRDAQGAPQRLDFVVIDVVTGLYGFQAVSAALLERARFGGGGRHIECSLMSAALALQAGKILESQIEPDELAMYVPLGVFRTADGHVSLSVRRDEHFVTFCSLLGKPEWARSGRFATLAERIDKREEFIPLLRAELARFSTDELCTRLTAAGILNARVNTYAEALETEQVRAAGAVQWQRHEGFEQDLAFAAVPGTQDRGAQAPRIGEHSVAVLGEWGVSRPLIDQLLAEGSINRAPGRPPGAVTR